jgi:hypothetical protein
VEGQGVSVASPKSGVSSAGMRSKLVNAPPAAEDEFGPYSTERLLEMDQRFRERLERAISDGRERPLTALQAGRANVRA